MVSRKPSTPAPRPRGRPAGRTTAQGVIADREKLLQAAEKLIRRNGPSVSLAAIATEAGVTKPILYREVGDKDALVNALAQRLVERMASTTTRLVAQARQPREGLRNLVAGYLQLAARERHLYLFVTAGGTGDDRVQQSLLLADGAASQFAAPIAAYRSARDADPGVATVWSYGLLGALHYVTLWWLREAAADIDEVTEQITTLLWSGMGLESD
jgi:AcrR family transcriptional regulator